MVTLVSSSGRGRGIVLRLLREAFRLEQHDLPPGVDLLIVAKAGQEGTLAEYQQSLTSLTANAYRKLQARFR